MTQLEEVIGKKIKIFGSLVKSFSDASLRIEASWLTATQLKESCRFTPHT